MASGSEFFEQQFQELKATIATAVDKAFVKQSREFNAKFDVMKVRLTANMNAFFKHFGISLTSSPPAFSAPPVPPAPPASPIAAAVKSSPPPPRSSTFNATVNTKRRCMTKSPFSALIIAKPPPPFFA